MRATGWIVVLVGFCACGGGSSGSNIDGGGAPVGTLLFEEPFDDDDFASRGWYDSSGGVISTAEHIDGEGSTGSFECVFGVGDNVCAGGTPARHPITPTDGVVLRFWIKFSRGWVGSDRNYHPHMFHFVTDADPDYVGPAATHLTTYIEIVGRRPLLALQDSLNVDPACILRNDDSFVGCNGDFATYPFTEDRSVAACNGLAGDVDIRDCFDNGGSWYSARAWDAPAWFTDAPGPTDQNAWHRVEALMRMNTIAGGVGQADGSIRMTVDGATVVSSDAVLFKTNANADILFDQFLMLPYIGDGSPIDQTFWVDELEVWTAP